MLGCPVIGYPVMCCPVVECPVMGFAWLTSRTAVFVGAEENVELNYDDPYLKLEFPAAQPLPPPCISVMNVSFGYEEGKLLCV